MPRIKPLRTKEEINAVPRDRPVTIELDPQVDDNPFEVADSNKEIIPPVIHNTQNTNKGPVPPVVQRVEPKTPSQASQDHDDLREQLEEMRKAKAESDRRIQEEIRARQDVERVAREREQTIRQREQEALRSKTRAEDAEYDAILNAISAAETEAEHAQRDITLGSEAQNAQLVGEASRRLARAEGRLAQLQDGKEAIERGKAMAKEAKPEQAPTNTRQPTVEEYIDQIPGLLSSQREWLRRHPETITDQRKNLRLQAAHVDAEDGGIRVGTDEYFQHLEERLGYRQPQQDEPEERDEVAIPRAPVAAPPSRSATNPVTGRQSTSRITLSPEQREAASLAGVDEITYAHNLRLMEERKRQGLLQ